MDEKVAGLLENRLWVCPHHLFICAVETLTPGCGGRISVCVIFLKDRNLACKKYTRGVPDGHSHTMSTDDPSSLTSTTATSNGHEMLRLELERARVLKAACEDRRFCTSDWGDAWTTVLQNHGAPVWINHGDVVQAHGEALVNVRLREAASFVDRHTGKVTYAAYDRTFRSLLLATLATSLVTKGHAPSNMHLLSLPCFGHLSGEQESRLVFLDYHPDLHRQAYLAHVKETARVTSLMCDAMRESVEFSGIVKLSGTEVDRVRARLLHRRPPNEKTRRHAVSKRRTMLPVSLEATHAEMVRLATSYYKGTEQTVPNDPVSSYDNRCPFLRRRRLTNGRIVRCSARLNARERRWNTLRKHRRHLQIALRRQDLKDATCGVFESVRKGLPPIENATDIPRAFRAVETAVLHCNEFDVQQGGQHFHRHPWCTFLDPFCEHACTTPLHLLRNGIRKVLETGQTFSTGFTRKVMSFVQSNGLESAFPVPETRAFGSLVENLAHATTAEGRLSLCRDGFARSCLQAFVQEVMQPMSWSAKTVLTLLRNAGHVDGETTASEVDPLGISHIPVTVRRHLADCLKTGDVSEALEVWADFSRSPAFETVVSSSVPFVVRIFKAHANKRVWRALLLSWDNLRPVQDSNEVATTLFRMGKLPGAAASPETWAGWRRLMHLWPTKPCPGTQCEVAKRYDRGNFLPRHVDATATATLVQMCPLTTHLGLGLLLSVLVHPDTLMRVVADEGAHSRFAKAHAHEWKVHHPTF